MDENREPSSNNSLAVRRIRTAKNSQFDADVWRETL